MNVILLDRGHTTHYPTQTPVVNQRLLPVEAGVRRRYCSGRSDRAPSGIPCRLGDGFGVEDHALTGARYPISISEERTNTAGTILSLNRGKHVTPEKERQPPVKGARVRSAKIIERAEIRVQCIGIGNTERNVRHDAVHANIGRGEVGSRSRAIKAGVWARTIGQSGRAAIQEKDAV